MRVYVAGPMTGIPDHNYPAFLAAAVQLADAGFDVLNPVDAEQHNDTGQPQTWDWYMRHSLRMVLDADGIALLPGWPSSRGARLEVTVAESLGLHVHDLNVWLNEKAAS